MQIFIDSANIEEINEINSMGFLSGVTTNPTLVAKEKRDYHQVIREICSIVNGPVSAEVISMDYHSMIREGQDLAAIHSNVVIKVPVTETGLKVIRTFKDMGIPTNATLVFSASQALLAARAGARYVSPFIGRVDDTSNDGLRLLSDLVAIFSQYEMETEIIAASIRHPMHVVDSAKLGSHIATIPYKIIKEIIKHPLTDAGIERFLSDWKKAF
ncbi:MAG: fructose-6-phosphate aldolase [Syntrophomonadaceae bacterium]